MLEEIFWKTRIGFFHLLTRLCLWLLKKPLNDYHDPNPGESNDSFKSQSKRRRPVSRVKARVLRWAERYLEWEAEQESEWELEEQQARENAVEPWIDNPFEKLKSDWIAEKHERERDFIDREREHQELIGHLRELRAAYQDKREKRKKQREEINAKKQKRKKPKQIINQNLSGNGEAYLWEDYRHILWFPWKYTRYRLSRERLFRRTGFLSREEETIPLYRIQDLHLTIKLSERLFGVGSIRVLSSDLTAPKLDILHIRNPGAVRDTLHRLSEDAKQRRQVQVMSMRGLDYNQSLSNLDPEENQENQDQD